MRIAFANMKGGVGKTTLAYTFATSFRAVGKAKILAIDLDPQAHLTHRFVDDETSAKRNISLFFEGKLSLADCIVKTRFEDVDLIPSHIFLGLVEYKLIQKPASVLKLKSSLEELKGYDFVVMDCPPNLGVFSTAGVIAADVVVCPITPDMLALEGLKYLTGWLKEISDVPQISEKKVVIVVNLVDKRYASHRVFVELAKKEYQAALAISRRVIYQRAINHGISPWKEASEGSGDAIKEIKEFIRAIVEVKG